MQPGFLFPGCKKGFLKIGHPFYFLVFNFYVLKRYFNRSSSLLCLALPFWTFLDQA
jgi:hypothetical protein